MNLEQVSKKYALDTVFVSYPEDTDYDMLLDMLDSVRERYTIQRYFPHLKLWQPYEYFSCSELSEKLEDERIVFERYYRMVDGNNS
jgi:hypothetical protein